MIGGDFLLNDIGKELKIIRIRKGYKLRYVAEKLNVSVETLRRYEKNSSGLSLEKLKKLLEIYKEEKDEILHKICSEITQNRSDI